MNQNFISINNCVKKKVTVKDMVGLLNDSNIQEVKVYPCYITSSDAFWLLNRTKYGCKFYDFNEEPWKTIHKKIDDGNFETDEPIEIARDGSVINGIKRLASITYSNQPLESIVIFNANKKTNISDDAKEMMYQFLDKTVVNMVYRVLKLYYNYKEITHEEIINYIDCNAMKMKEFSDGVILSHHYPRTKSIIYNSSFLAASWLAFLNDDISIQQIKKIQETMSLFHDQVKNGDYSIKGNGSEFGAAVYVLVRKIKTHGLASFNSIDMLLLDCLAMYDYIKKDKYHKVSDMIGLYDSVCFKYDDVVKDYCDIKYKGKEPKFPKYR